MCSFGVTPPRVTDSRGENMIHKRGLLCNKVGGCKIRSHSSKVKRVGFGEIVEMINEEVIIKRIDRNSGNDGYEESTQRYLE